MYHSLISQEPKAYVYIFAFDDIAFQILSDLQLEKAQIIDLQTFEDHDLLAIKGQRSRAEYCWTCTSSIINYCLQNFDIDAVTYVDADLYFFDSPAVLLQEIPSSHSILLTEHRYSKGYDNSAVSGIYCVQFMTFKKTHDGLLALDWWRKRCLEWCFARFEDGKFGDQKYLDDWLTRFYGVWVLQHEGGGLAPWNTQQYHYTEEKQKIFFENIQTRKKNAVIFYHFHYLRFYSNHPIILAGKYNLDSSVKQLIYTPYLAALEKSAEMIRKINPNIDPHGTTKYSKIPSWQKIKDKIYTLQLKFKSWLN